MSADKPQFPTRHNLLPQLIVILELDDGRRSVMLSNPALEDIDERLARYVDEWNAMFDAKIKIISKELIE